MLCPACVRTMIQPADHHQQPFAVPASTKTLAADILAAMPLLLQCHALNNRCSEAPPSPLIPEHVCVLQLPTDVFQNPDVQQLFDEVQAYQQQFVQLHKASTANQAQGEDPASLRARLQQLDNQKQQLKDKVSRARAKVQTVPNLKALQVTACMKYQQP